MPSPLCTNFSLGPLWTAISLVTCWDSKTQLLPISTAMIFRDFKSQTSTPQRHPCGHQVPQSNRHHLTSSRFSLNLHSCPRPSSISNRSSNIAPHSLFITLRNTFAMPFDQFILFMIGPLRSCLFDMGMCSIPALCIVHRFAVTPYVAHKDPTSVSYFIYLLA